MRSWVAVVCGGRVAAQIDMHRDQVLADSIGANGSVRSTSRQWKLLCTKVGWAIRKRSAVECFAECASELLPRVGLAKHFDSKHGFARRERHVAIAGGQHHIAVCTVAPHEEVIAKAADLHDGGAFIAMQLHGQPRH